MPLTKLEKQLSFLKEIDRLKRVIRQSPLLDKSRKENAAEHSWHLAVYALILDEYACGTADTNRVMQMLLLHDIVEIDVGDFPIHSGASSDMQAEQESRAALRLFGLLPQPQCNEFLALWQEFEHAKTEDAKFAKALDRFQPLLVNIFADGGTWTEQGVSIEQVFSRYGPVIKRGTPELWAVCERWIIQHFSERAPGNTAMTNQLDGVRPASESSIEIEFQYRGTLCRERLRLKPSASNLRRASDLRAGILRAIEKDEFDYAAAFPKSKNAARFPN